MWCNIHENHMCERGSFERCVICIVRASKDFMLSLENHIWQSHHHHEPWILLAVMRAHWISMESPQNFRIPPLLIQRERDGTRFQMAQSLPHVVSCHVIHKTWHTTWHMSCNGSLFPLKSHTRVDNDDELRAPPIPNHRKLMTCLAFGCDTERAGKSSLRRWMAKMW